MHANSMKQLCGTHMFIDDNIKFIVQCKYQWYLENHSAI